MGDLDAAITGTPGQGGQIVDTTPDEFEALRGPVAGGLQGLIESGGGPTYSDPFTASMTDQEQGLLDQIGGQARSSQGADAARGMLTDTLSGDYLTPDSNPFLKSQMDEVSRQFENTVMPRLRSQFTEAGHQVTPESSSPFDRAAAEASQGLAAELTGMAGQAYQQERGNQMQAASQLPQINQAEMNRAIQGLEKVALPRLIEQKGIDEGLKEFRRQQDQLLKALQLGSQVGGPSPVSLPGTEPQQGALSYFAQGAGSALSNYALGGG